jgi:hypothetical protein
MGASAILTRFPLTPRPRPPCTPLSQRVAAITQLARTAVQDRNPTQAAAVFNRSALLAADCGLPDLARGWCRKHVNLWLGNLPLDARSARHALEPLVNLARLEMREGNGSSAFQLLDALYQAVATRATATVAGIVLPAAQLTTTPGDHYELRRWLWTVHLSDGTRALTSAGRWQEALAHLERHNGIGQRMLDGRQVAIVGSHLAGDTTSALELLETTSAHESWEHAVKACLAALCQRNARLPVSQHRSTMIGTCSELSHAAGLSLFQTRLGLTVIDIAGGTRHRDVQTFASELIAQVTGHRDGYAAREILAHQDCASVLTDAQLRDLTHVTKLCALGTGFPAPVNSKLTNALDSLDQTIRRLANDQSAYLLTSAQPHS